VKLPELNFIDDKAGKPGKMIFALKGQRD